MNNEFTSSARDVPLSGRYQRVGTVWASQLTEDHAWLSAQGDSLSGWAGDWMVVSPDSIARIVAAAEFSELYEWIVGQQYRRHGSVHARKAVMREDVATLEGIATARPGDWVVTDDRGNSWPVPDGVFRAGYAPSQPSSGS